MTTELIKMSQKEIDRLEIVQQVLGGHIPQKRGAKQLKITTRQLRRLQKSYAAFGASGLISKRRGKVSNNRLPESLKESIINAAKEERYQGFGATLLHEKLFDVHQGGLSVESLRKLMMKSGLWAGKSRKKVKVYQSRARRSQLGELLQLDGSPHAWFEERGEKCCLHVLIDDATGRLTGLHFAAQECTAGYFKLLEQHLHAYGRPLAVYADRHSIFRVNIPEAKGGDGETQFGRVLRELDIGLICANSPQAKGRVERANGVLQDRLVKELRLRGISDIESANAFLPEYIKQHNERFAVEAASSDDAHRRSLPAPEVMALILSEQYTRTISKNLEVHFQHKVYQIQVNTPSYNMRGAKVTVCEKGEVVTLIYKQQSLPYKVFDKHNKPASVASSKALTKRLDSRRKKPAADHPWRKKYAKLSLQNIG